MEGGNVKNRKKKTQRKETTNGLFEQGWMEGWIQFNSKAFACLFDDEDENDMIHY